MIYTLALLLTAAATAAAGGQAVTYEIDGDAYEGYFVSPGKKAPLVLLILHGTADTNITMDHFAGLANQLEQHGVGHEMITYGGAPCAFTVFGSSRYRKHADEKSWQRFMAFLEERFGSRQP
jgi:dienelactone hydrolase